MNWYDREEDELVRQLNAGEINQNEFQNAMRDLNAQLRQEAEDNAADAFNRTMGNY